MQKISKNLAEHLVYLTGIQNGVETDLNGELPTVIDRIRAGACVTTVFAIMDNDSSETEENIIAAIREFLGEKWPGPNEHTRKATEDLKDALLCS